MSDVVHAAGAPKPVGAYPHARRVGNLLFLSGVGPRDPATNAIVGNLYDVEGRLRHGPLHSHIRTAEWLQTTTSHNPMASRRSVVARQDVDDAGGGYQSSYIHSLG